MPFALGEHSLAIHGGSKVRVLVSDGVATALGPPQRPQKALASSLIVDPVENAQLLKTPGAVNLMYQLTH